MIDKTKGEMPLGFGMALAQNEAAMQAFSSLSAEQKKDCLAKAKKVSSKDEMTALVDSLSPTRTEG